MNLCYVGWTGRVSQADSALVKCLLQQGAVLYCYTNMPQALFSGETICNLHGRTVNPHNRALAVGGSSGGEGALVAMHGSPLGVGSDIGGSIR
jgi:amidase